MNFKLLFIFACGSVLTSAPLTMEVSAPGGVNHWLVKQKQPPRPNQSWLKDDNFEKFSFKDNAWTYKIHTSYWNLHGNLNWKDCAQYNCCITERTMSDFIHYVYGFKDYEEGVMVWMSNFASGFSYAEETSGIFQDTIEQGKLRLRGDRNFKFSFKGRTGQMVNFLEQYAAQGWTGPVKVQFFYRWIGFGNLYEVNAARSA